MSSMVVLMWCCRDTIAYHCDVTVTCHGIAMISCPAIVLLSYLDLSCIEVRDLDINILFIDTHSDMFTLGLSFYCYDILTSPWLLSCNLDISLYWCHRDLSLYCYDILACRYIATWYLGLSLYCYHILACHCNTLKLSCGWNERTHNMEEKVEDTRPTRHRTRRTLNREQWAGR